MAVVLKEGFIEIRLWKYGIFYLNYNYIIYFLKINLNNFLGSLLLCFLSSIISWFIPNCHKFPKTCFGLPWRFIKNSWRSWIKASRSSFCLRPWSIKNTFILIYIYIHRYSKIWKIYYFIIIIFFWNFLNNFLVILCCVSSFNK